MKKSTLYLRPLLSAVLLSLSWYSPYLIFLVFVALIPLLQLFDAIDVSSLRKKGRAYFATSFLAFLLWNIATTFWVFNSTPAAVMAFLINATLMALVITFYYHSRKQIFKGQSALTLLVVYWIGFEFFHQNWDVSWPWLTLGNVFARLPQAVQFYEWTGNLGGTLWIWAVNILLYKAWRRRQAWRVWLPAALVLLLPLTYSLIRYYSFEEEGERVEVVVVQPNIDPYAEQYDLPPLVSTQRMLALAQQKVSERTRLVVTPESMIQEYIWEDEMQFSPSIGAIQAFLAGYDSLHLLAGLSSAQRLAEGESHPAARRLNDRQSYVAHNTACLISKDGLSPLYYKSKLTPAVEVMPFVKYFKPLEKLALDLGGTVGTLGVSDERVVMATATTDGLPAFSPVICYESIYADFVRRFVRNGAQFLCIITNDGWWGNTPGYRQHADYARLRAIECRRDIVRSANTGTSCYINARGDVFQSTPYAQEAALVQEIYARQDITPFVRYGDLMGRVCRLLMAMFLLLTVARRMGVRG